MTRAQILAFRRRVGALDQRLPAGKRSLRQAAWAGIQDSMPRAALLSIHARVEGVTSAAWEDSSLAQVWGPRYHVYVVAARDHAVFTLGRLPDGGKIRDGREELAERAARPARRGANEVRRRRAGARNARQQPSLRRSDGHARDPLGGRPAAVVWTVPPPEIEPAEATRELARRYLHVFGPARPDGFAKWAGIGAKKAARGVRRARRRAAPGADAVRRRLAPRARRAAMREPPPDGRGAAAAERRCLHARRHERGPCAPRAGRRPTCRAVDAACVARRAPRGREGRRHVAPRRANVHDPDLARLTRAAQEAVVAEAESLPLPDADGRIVVHWT